MPITATARILLIATNPSTILHEIANVTTTYPKIIRTETPVRSIPNHDAQLKFTRPKEMIAKRCSDHSPHCHLSQ